MPTRNIKIKIRDDDHLKEIAKDAVDILQNLLYAEEYWGEHYGSESRNLRNAWRLKAHDFLYRIDENNKPTTNDEKVD